MKLISEQKKWIWNKLIPGIIFFGGLGFVIIQGQRYQYLLRKSPRYTIGYTIDTHWTVASGNQLNYEFEVYKRTYKKSYRYNDKSKVPGGRYYVKFYDKDPNICEILQDMPVPDSVKFAPVEGWKKVTENK